MRKVGTKGVEQQVMFGVDYGGLIKPRLLCRRDDPATSKQAARWVVESGRLTKGQIDCLAHIRAFGPGTTWEIALRHPWVVRGRVTPESLHYLMARRLPELERKGLVRVQRDAEGREMVRERSRVWEVVP